MKKKYILSKTLWQIFLYLFEILSISMLLAYLTTFISSIGSLYDFIDRTIMCYTVYQILVVVILTNINDIKKDSCLAYITLLKQYLLYINTKDKNIKYNILQKIELQLDASTFNDNEFRNAYIKIKDNFDNIDEKSINCELINAEHIYESISLNWNFSFLLRIYKVNKKKM